MKVGIIGLGRMGEGMSRRMMKTGIETVGYRRNYEKAKQAAESGYITSAADTLESLVQVVKTTDSGKYQPGIFMMVVPAETYAKYLALNGPDDKILEILNDELSHSNELLKAMEIINV